MEIGQIQCDNLGMVKDTNISALNRGDNSSINYAFENYNIRITSIDDNTKFTVTNEKSTSLENGSISNQIIGTFLGGCTINDYLIVFTKDTSEQSINKDYIYRINYSNSTLNVYTLYHGNLEFDINHPIEALGYYESAEIQKVYWVDGKNQNRFINISSDADTGRVTSGNDYQFDFQGRINNLPSVTITKDYNKAGTFQAGVIQYFITYYNKYGIETCLVYNSDLQYISLNDRGGKADEAVSCAFDLEITNIDTSYDFIRIYASYRSGINDVVSTRILTDINIKDRQTTDIIKFSDLGALGVNFNFEDLFYVGGQNIIANTLDYKLDTLFLGDIKINQNSSNISFNKKSIQIDVKDSQGNNVTIQEGYTPTTALVKPNKPYLYWSYKYVSPIASEGVYSHTQEINQSQQEIAGFKWREIYRFGIQFMSNEGEWTPVYWLGDKYCDRKPRTFISSQFEGLTKDTLGCYKITETIDENDNIIEDSSRRPIGTMFPSYSLIDTLVNYTLDGCYIANISVDFEAIKYGTNINLNTYKAYRLLVAETDITNRRIIEQGVINPTMFNYTDRHYNRPYSIPSYIFRPRLSKITNRHYDTLPLLTEFNAELQGITTRQVPAVKTTLGVKYNSYMFILAANGTNKGLVQWKLIYFNSGNNDIEKAEKLKLNLFTGRAATGLTITESEYTEIADLLYKYRNKGIAIKPNNADNKPGYLVLKTNDGRYFSSASDIKTYLKGEATAEPEFVGVQFVPAYIYGDDYLVVSSQKVIHGDREDDRKSWEDVYGALNEGLSTDTKNTTIAQVGVELAGKLILVGNMLPNADLLKKISKEYVSSGAIVGGLVTSIAQSTSNTVNSLSGGTLDAPIGVAAVNGLSSCITMLAGPTVGCATASATGELAKWTLPELALEMAAKNYYAVYNSNIQDTNTGHKQKMSLTIGNLLDRYFAPDLTLGDNGYEPNGMYNWNVPLLKGDPWYPFKTGHNYTERPYLGLDYVAYATTGLLTSLTEDEEDLNRKQNLFCIDESVVTLNSPSVEDNNTITNNSEALNLDIVGMVPFNSVQGEYNIEATNGLNSSSLIIRGKFITSPIGDSSNNTIGLLNANLYQDYFNSSVAIFDTLNPVLVTESTSIYKTFMWNRETSIGFHFPNLQLKDVFDNDITEVRSRLVHKIFANLRYSKNTDYYKPFTLAIESPITCLDSLIMLKTFKYFGDIKNYYENVDTISVNTTCYPLVVLNIAYPDTETRINNGGIKDPIHIKYKETPHILIPIKWNISRNCTTILPYTQNESIITPTDLYGDTVEDIKDYKFEGVTDDIKTISNFFYVSPDTISSSDVWNISSKIALTTGLINTFNGYTHETLNDSNFNTYLFLTSNITWYLISGKSTLGSTSRSWYSIRITTIPFNSKIKLKESIINNGVFVNPNLPTYIFKYATKNVDQNNSLQCILTDNIQDLLTTKPLKGTWNQSELPWINTTTSPYLFIGELIKKSFDYSTWNGGTSNNSLQLLNWNIASMVTSINSNYITTTWGDTYYQRWDCQKTYPFTEEDTNSNVEILSFMLESHKNLDGRCDINRGIHNLLNIRPTNTVYNTVYELSDNFFSYKVLDNQFNKSHFEADVVWSLSKNNNEVIDRWTNLVATNEMSLDGRYGTIRKILNVNDVLVAFLDKGISAIKYNESTALNTTSGLPLLIANTGKVDGYRMISDSIGCHNKFSISKNSAGVFFADDFNKSFNMFSSNGGIQDIGMEAEFSVWFKNNFNGQLWTPSNNNYRASYDEITHDLYLIKDDKCLVYNTSLHRFTSFMSYINTPIMTRLNDSNGISRYLALKQDTNELKLYKLFDEDSYGNIYGTLEPYSIEYRVCPDPMHDSIFTNYQYSADWINPNKKSDVESQFDTELRRFTTFDKIKAWNEYQSGEDSIETARMGIHNIKAKFRIWRGNIPRDGNALHGDRMRNPWLHVKFTKDYSHDNNENKNSKMIFHNLIITYYNQYGRL